MKALIYENTKTNTHVYLPTLHNTLARGMAYKCNSHFVHIYGKANDLWAVDTNNTVGHPINNSLESWIDDLFGANNIQNSKNLVGEVVSNVWRPGLCSSSEIFQAFSITEYEQRSAE